MRFTTRPVRRKLRRGAELRAEPAPLGGRGASRPLGRSARLQLKARKDVDAGDPLPPKKSDPFGFDSGRNEGPVPIIPGFDTAEGGKVGPLGTAGISVLLFVLFGGSLFFTSVPRGAVEDVAKMALENDPDAPVNVLRR